MVTLSIEMPAQAAQRVASAVGSALGLRDDSGAARSATAAEVKAYVITILRNEVRRQETAKSIEAARAAVSDIDMV